jgi:hypothetical protein
LSFHSILKPELLDGFASVLVTSANFECSLMYQLWKDRFEKDATFDPRFDQHVNGHRIAIHYFTDLHWSKRLATHNDNLTRIMERTAQIFGHERFLYRVNKGTKTPFGSHAVLLPNKPQGQNGYAEYNNIAGLSAINATPWHIRFLVHHGIAPDAIHQAFYYPDVYQSVLRTSIRRPDATAPVNVVVVDQGAAEYLQAKFPGAKLVHHEIGVAAVQYQARGRSRGRPRKWASNAERQAQYRRRQCETKIAAA